MERSENINELATALAKAQGAMLPVKKDKTARIETKGGSSYSYRYADLADVLEAIRKPLSDNGLALIQSSHVNNGSVEVETILAHASGQWVGDTIALPIVNADPRSLGSLITYGRRYGLQLTGVVTDEDDDAETAGRKAEPRQRTATEIKQSLTPVQPVNATVPPPVPAEWNAMTTAQEEHAAPTPAPELNGKPLACNITKALGFTDAAIAMIEKLEGAGIHTGYKLKKGGYDFEHMRRSLAAEGYLSLSTEQLQEALAKLELRVIHKIQETS